MQTSPDEEADDRVHFTKGDILTVRARRAPGFVSEACQVIAAEDGASGGCDVYDVLTLEGIDSGLSIYGFQVESCTPKEFLPRPLDAPQTVPTF